MTSAENSVGMEPQSGGMKPKSINQSKPMTASKMTKEGKSATAHYGDPCLYCHAPMQDVASGPCPARAQNKPGERVQFRMSQADYDGIISAINAGRNTPLIAINVGMPRSPQEAANDAWCALGNRLGFDGMTVAPVSGSKLAFTARTTPEATA